MDCFPPLEACRAPLDFMKISPREDVFQVNFSSFLQVLCLTCVVSSAIVLTLESAGTQATNNLCHFGGLLKPPEQQFEGRFPMTLTRVLGR